MMSNRSYREGLDKESAVLELHKENGTQFGPFPFTPSIPFSNSTWISILALCFVGGKVVTSW
jgi:hypothetical protein